MCPLKYNITSNTTVEIGHTTANNLSTWYSNELWVFRINGSSLWKAKIMSKYNKGFWEKMVGKIYCKIWKKAWYSIICIFSFMRECLSVCLPNLQYVIVNMSLFTTVSDLLYGITVIRQNNIVSTHRNDTLLSLWSLPVSALGLRGR